MRKHETLTEVESSHGTLYSAKLCKYTHFTTRSVSKSNILKLNFVNYCTVQDPARNVLQLLYYNFFSSYHYNEDTFFSFFKMSLDSHFNCPDDVKAAFFLLLLPRSGVHLYTAWARGMSDRQARHWDATVTQQRQLCHWILLILLLKEACTPCFLLQSVEH